MPELVRQGKHAGVGRDDDVVEAVDPVPAEIERAGETAERRSALEQRHVRSGLREPEREHGPEDAAPDDPDSRRVPHSSPPSGEIGGGWMRPTRCAAARRPYATNGRREAHLRLPTALAPVVHSRHLRDLRPCVVELEEKLDVRREAGLAHEQIAVRLRGAAKGARSVHTVERGKRVDVPEPAEVAEVFETALEAASRQPATPMIIPPGAYTEASTMS